MLRPMQKGKWITEQKTNVHNLDNAQKQKRRKIQDPSLGLESFNIHVKQTKQKEGKKPCQRTYTSFSQIVGGFSLCITLSIEEASLTTITPLKMDEARAFYKATTTF